MATQFTFLMLAVCLASAIASTPTRDPKELLILPHPYSPFYRVPSMQSRYGLTQRQTNSPINPMIGQQGLGPFFGYFPNLLTQPCPACAECEICPACDVCPVVPEVPPAEELTACDAEGVVSSAPNGTIKLDVTATSSVLICKFGLVAYYPNTKVQLKCSAISSYNSLNLSPLVTPTPSSGAVINVDYESQKQVLFIGVANGQDTTKNVAVECSWTNIPA